MNRHSKLIGEQTDHAVTRFKLRPHFQGTAPVVAANSSAHRRNLLPNSGSDACKEKNGSFGSFGATGATSSFGSFGATGLGLHQLSG